MNEIIDNTGQEKEVITSERAAPPPVDSITNTPRRSPLRRRKTLVFGFIAILLGLSGLWFGTELILRINGFGYQSSFFLQTETNGEPVYVNNPDFGLRFFPKQLVRKPEPFVMPVIKKPDTCRIFVLGGSAALGDPNPAFGFSRILEIMLEEKYPNVRFEIINTAMTAINSHVVLQIAQECAKHEPDLFVIYLGNNEVVGPFGAGTVFTDDIPPLYFIRARLALLEWRTGQFLHAVLPGSGSSNQTPSRWRGMDMLGEEHYVPSGSPKLQAVYQNFRSNLESICRIANDNDIPVLVSTVAVNLKDFAPFASIHRKDLTPEETEEWQTHVRTGIELAAEERFAGAITEFQRALAIDDRHAELHFHTAICLFADKRIDDAKQHYEAARELDALRFRADSTINQTIRDTAARFPELNIRLLDFEKRIEDESVEDIAGNKYFYEHVHLSVDGNYLLAQSIMEEIHGLLPDFVLKLENPEATPPSLKHCNERLAYTLWERYKITESLYQRMSSPPFTHCAYNESQVQRLKKEMTFFERTMTLNLIAQHRVQYSSAIEHSPGDWRLHYNFARVLMASGNQPDAEQYFKNVISLIPHQPEGYFDLGVCYLEQQKYSDALAQFARALTINPNYTDAMYNAAVTYEKDQNTEQAVEQYESLLTVDPGYVNAYFNLAGISVGRQEWDKAFDYLLETTKIQPGSTGGYIELGILMGRQKKFAEAAGWFQKALDINPNENRARMYLEAANKETKNESPNPR